MKKIYVAAVLCISTAGWGHAQVTGSNDVETDSRLDTLFGAHEPYASFLAKLKSAAAKEDWATIGDLIAYPLKVTVGGQHLVLRSAAQFRARATNVMTAKVLNAIKEQSYAGLFANAQGVMMGNGEVWFSAICGPTDCNNAPIKITAIQQ